MSSSQLECQLRSLAQQPSPTASSSAVVQTAKALADGLRSAPWRTEFGTAVFTEALVSLLRSFASALGRPEAEDALVELLRVVANLCLDHNDNRALLLNASAPTLILDLVSSISRPPRTQPLPTSSLKVLRTAFGSLINLTQDYEPIQSHLIDAHAVSTILRVLDCAGPGAVYSAAKRAALGREEDLNELMLGSGIVSWGWRILDGLLGTENALTDASKEDLDALLSWITAFRDAASTPPPSSSSHDHSHHHLHLHNPFHHHHHLHSHSHSPPPPILLEPDTLADLLDEELSSLESACTLLETLALDVERARTALAAPEALRALLGFVECGGLPREYAVEEEEEEEDGAKEKDREGEGDGEAEKEQEKEREGRDKLWGMCKAAVVKSVIAVAGEDKNMDVLFQPSPAPQRDSSDKPSEASSTTTLNSTTTTASSTTISSSAKDADRNWFVAEMMRWLSGGETKTREREREKEKSREERRGRDEKEREKEREKEEMGKESKEEKKREKEERKRVKTGKGVDNKTTQSLVVCSTLALGNLARKDENCVALVQQYDIIPRLMPLLRFSKIDPKVAHGVVALLKNLALPATNKSPLGDAGVIDAAARFLDSKYAPVQPLQFATVGLYKHLCAGILPNSLRLVGVPPAPLAAPHAPFDATPLDALLALIARTDDVPVRSEGARVLVNAVKAFWSSTSACTDVEPERVDRARVKMVREEVARALAELIRASRKYPILLNEGILGLTLMGSEPAGAKLVLAALCPPPASASASAPSMDVAPTSPISPTSPTSTTASASPLSTLTWILSSPASQMSSKLKTNACILLSAAVSKGADGDRQAGLSLLSLLSETRDSLEECVKSDDAELAKAARTAQKAMLEGSARQITNG